MHPQESNAPAAHEIKRRFQHALALERAAFAAKVRLARAVLGLSQAQFAGRIGLTQKSVHRIEQESVEPKLRTVGAIEQFWIDNGLHFEDLDDGGFCLSVDGSALRRE